MPLKSIDYKVNIENNVACVTISQTYFNSAMNPQEMEYRFPISINAAFTGLSAEYEKN